jgi:hypothetical protein
MSDFRAIGGVSASLQTLLRDRMELPDMLSNVVVPVTISPPRINIDDKPVKESPRINLYLYRVGENGFLQNQEIPGHGSAGAFGSPPLSLNLHYLVTAFGNDALGDGANSLFDETVAHFLLGSAMRVLHDYTILTEDLLTIKQPVGTPILHDSLLGSYEKVKLSLEPISLEDATKVWVALTLRYRLSAAYSITVVQIESKSKRAFPRLVGAPPSAYPPLSPVPAVPGPYIPVGVFSSPFISGVHVRRLGSLQEQPFPFASIGDKLILLGSGFAGGVVKVALDNVDVPVSPITSNRIEVTVPDGVVPGVGLIPPANILEPGSQPLAVIVANPAFPQGAVRSNNAAFVLVPSITAPIAYSAGPPRTITVNGSRLFSPNMTGETIIGRASVDKSLYSSPTPTQIVVPIPDALPVNGVQMLLASPLNGSTFTPPPNPSMTVTIVGKTANVNLTSTQPIPIAELPQLLNFAILNGAVATIPPPIPPEFLGLRVGLFGKRLVLVAGGLTKPIVVADAVGGALATALGFNLVPIPPGASHGYLSGDLSEFPAFPGSTVGVTVQAGLPPGVAVTLAAPTYIDVGANLLQAAIQTVSPGALVGVLGTQLLIMPGAATSLTFGPTLSDAVSVFLLQLHARYNVRVRVNGYDSIDDTTLELPQ